MCRDPNGCRRGDIVYPGSAEGVTTHWVHGGHQCFWNGREDPHANAERVATLEALFARKYPGTKPADIPGPACGW